MMTEEECLMHAETKIAEIQSKLLFQQHKLPKRSKKRVKNDLKMIFTYDTLHHIGHFTQVHELPGFAHGNGFDMHSINIEERKLVADQYCRIRMLGKRQGPGFIFGTPDLEAGEKWTRSNQENAENEDGEQQQDNEVYDEEELNDVPALEAYRSITKRDKQAEYRAYVNTFEEDLTEQLQVSGSTNLAPATLLTKMKELHTQYQIIIIDQKGVTLTDTAKRLIQEEEKQ